MSASQICLRCSLLREVAQEIGSVKKRTFAFSRAWRRPTQWRWEAHVNDPGVETLKSMRVIGSNSGSKAAWEFRRPADLVPLAQYRIGGRRTPSIRFRAVSGSHSQLHGGAPKSPLVWVVGPVCELQRFA